MPATELHQVVTTAAVSLTLNGFRQPLRQLDHEATQMMRTDTQEERSAADFIVDWQMDQEDSESNTFDLPSDEELADLVGADETQQWELPPELSDPSVDDTTPGTGTGTKRRKS